MLKNINIRQSVSETDFNKYYELRWRILRKPWGQPKGSEVNDRDDDAFHILAEENDEVVGVSCIHEIEDGVGRIRFMAVEDDFQNLGIGKKMIQELENYASQQGWTSIRLWAREIAWDFYLKLGYKIIADGELLFGVIKHKIMEKSL